MSRLAVGRNEDGRGPAVWFMDLDSGHAAPIPTALDNGGAFDEAQSRRGWTAIKVEYQIGAIEDGGDIRRPVLLPQAWQMFPAARDDLLLVTRYFGSSTRPEEHTHVAALGPDGRVYRSMELPWPHGSNPTPYVIGEVDAGVVTSRGIVGWDAHVTPLPVESTGNWATEPRGIGTLAGRVIVFQHPDSIESVDMTTGFRQRLAIPPEQLMLRPGKPLFGLTPPPTPPSYNRLVRHNAAGTWLTSFSHGLSSQPGRLLAGPGGELRWLPAMAYATWFDDHLLLQAYDQATSQLLGDAIDYDPVSDTTTLVTIRTRRSDGELSPRVGVTGRLDFPS